MRIIRKFAPCVTEQCGQHTQTSGCTNYRNEYLHFDWNHRLPVTLSWSTIRNYLSYNRIMSKELFLCWCTAYTNLKLKPHSWCVQSSNIKIYQNASTCKKRDQLINTKLRIQQLSYTCASCCGTALRIKPCRVVSMFWNSFNFWPGPSCRITGKLDLFYMICNGAVWCSISIISDSTQQHERTTLLTAMWHHQSR
jgi:hypothetical protein